MMYTLAGLLALFFVQIALGVPLFAINAASTTKHWEIEPREKSSRHWEIQPRDQNQEYKRDNESLLTGDTFEGGDGTVPPGAANDGSVKEISMVPFGLEDSTGIIPPGAVNDGSVKEISMVPFGLEEGTGTIPPGGVNDENAHIISMDPYAINKIPYDATNVTEGPWEGSQGTVPPGAQNDGNSTSTIMRGAMFLLRAFGL